MPVMMNMSRMAIVAFLVNTKEDSKDNDNTCWRNKPRKQKRKFRHKEALKCICRDYLGIAGDPLTPLFVGVEFKRMFRISRPRFQRMMEDIAALGDSFYTSRYDAVKSDVASFEAKLLLPLKCLAYGVPPHCFQDYFQMSMTLCKKCCWKFDETIKSLYEKEYLRLPTKADLKGILKLHKKVHLVDGMFGSLDCMHTYWKNCPVAWQGSYKGKEKCPSIVLEAASDHNMWFWHAAYGFAGTLNDINILNLSPLLASFLDGSFHELESEVVPFDIAGMAFNMTFLLVDGIYPKYSRFVKGITEPIGRREKKFTQWQEAARKDIERAFGVLQQAKFQVLARPIHTMNLERIGKKVACCLILHNMCVSDRVMGGDVTACYNPSEQILECEPVDGIAQPTNLIEVQECTMDRGAGPLPGARNSPAAVVELVTRHGRWTDLKDPFEHAKLHYALMNQKENEDFVLVK